MDEQNVQKQLDELKNELLLLKKRATEDEAVIASLQAWTQYSFGILLRHLDDPGQLNRDGASQRIEMVFRNMYRTLKEGFRGAEELEISTDGFDRLYICATDTADIWQSMNDHNFANDSDLNGYKLINAALDMLEKIDPSRQHNFPFETKKEKQIRKAARDLIFQAKRL